MISISLMLVHRHVAITCTQRLSDVIGSSTKRKTSSNECRLVCRNLFSASRSSKICYNKYRNDSYPYYTDVNKVSGFFSYRQVAQFLAIFSPDKNGRLKSIRSNHEAHSSRILGNNDNRHKPGFYSARHA